MDFFLGIYFVSNLPYQSVYPNEKLEAGTTVAKLMIVELLCDTEIRTK